jgi:hypothetical protein
MIILVIELYSLLELDYSVELDNNVSAETCFAYLLRFVYSTMTVEHFCCMFLSWDGI